MININDNVILNPDNVVIAEQKGSMYKLTLNNGKILYVTKELYDEIIAYEGGGGGGGSSAELYEHNILIGNIRQQLAGIKIITNNDTPFNYNLFRDFLVANGYINQDNFYTANSVRYINNVVEIVRGYWFDTLQGALDFACLKTATNTYSNSNYSTTITFFDTMRRI